MEKLEDTEIIKFRPDTLEVVRKEFGLDKPGMLEQSLDNLDLWLQKQQHFIKKDFSREYMERTLISCKGSVERTKSKLDKLCTMKNLLPQYFDTYECDAKLEIEPYEDTITYAFIPMLSPSQERIFFARNTGIKPSTMLPLYKNIIKIFEYLKTHEYSLGFAVILDFSNLNIMEFLPKLNPIDVRNTLSILLDGFGFRLKAMHIVSSSKMIDAVVSLFKQVMSAKLGKRIYVHKNFDTVYASFPRVIMPKDYGGPGKTLKELHDDLQNALTTEDFMNYLKEMTNARTNETLRSTSAFNEQYMGVPGSFKVLSVD